MNEHVAESGGTGPSHRGVEVGVALFMGLLGAIAIVGSLDVGIGWGAEGPKAGFFTFYVGLIVVLSSVVNLWNDLKSSAPDKPFAEWPQLVQVVSVLIPTAIYVALIPNLGMYVSSFLLIAVFMKWFGRYSWLTTIAIAIFVPVALFFTFELWFLVPLPKGPVENFLGY